MNTEGITITTICRGNASVFRALGIPLSDALDADDGIDLHEGDVPPPLQTEPHPQMGAAAIAAMIGVLVFFGSWAARKVLDEFYEAKIRPKIKHIFESSDAKGLSNNPGKKWLFQLGVWYKEERVLVLLTLVGDSLNKILRQEHLLPTLHSHAVDWLIQHGTDSPVHLYIAEDGKANLEPLTFNHVTEAQRYIEELWPVIIPTSSGTDKAV